MFRTRLSAALLAASLGAFSCAAWGQTGYTITGGLSNFDCNNHCDDPCDEFEIEIEGQRPEDILGTYHNGNYGAPRVVLSSDGTFTIIDYRNPQHLTAVGAIEHFGVSLRQLSSANAIRVRWMRNGAPATVNGRIPNQGGGTSPASQPLMPSINADMGFGGPSGNVTLSVTNNDPAQWIWIKRSAQLMVGNGVALEALMSNNPVVTSSIAIDNSPIALLPGQTVSYTSDLVEVEDNQSVIFSARYYQDLFSAGPFNQQHVIGTEMGNVMTASIASPDAGCAGSEPVFQDQPQSIDAAAGREVPLRVNVEGNGYPVTYSWLKDGQPITASRAYSGLGTDELVINELSAATEGFYAVRATNTCGTSLSQSAMVYITGHNIIPAPLGASVDPTSLSVSPGDMILLTGNCSFVPQGSTYIWKHNGVVVHEGNAGASVGGGFVIGSSGSADAVPVALEIDGATAADAGTYTVSFLNAGGQATSAPATVTVDVPCSLSIDAQPMANAACIGGTAAFGVAATGTGDITYQWQVSNDLNVWFTMTPAGTTIACGGALATATAAPANAPNVDIGISGCAGQFAVRCVVSDSCGTLASDPTLMFVVDCTPPCPADFNQDGGVDGADIEAFFIAWEASDAAADVNLDGGVDGSDVETFFSAWEAGGC